MNYSKFMEALKGKQHKIDKNKNGEIDAQDFKLLRKEESDESTQSQELDEIHRMKTKLNALDPFSAKAVARQKLSNLMKSGKARGALIANQQRTLNMGEEVEQVEEKMDLAKADMGDVIKDFKDSDAPQFKGKSDEKKRQMAIAAKLQADDMNTEQAPIAPVPDKKYIKGTPEYTAYKATKKPINGMPTNKMEEEVEDLEERSDQAKQNKTMKNLMTTSKGAQVNRTLKLDPADYGYKKAQHLNKAIGRQMMKTEATDTVVKDKTGKVISFKHVGDWKKATEKKDPVGKVANMAGQAMQKMKSMSEEKDEQEYGYEGDMAISQLKTIIRHSEHLMGMLKPDTDLPEWVQSKITLATDYMQTAHDYMMSEMNESKAVTLKVNAAGEKPREEKWETAKKVQKEEVQKADIPAYLRKAKGDTPLKMSDLKRKDTISDPENLKKARGIDEEEGYELPQQITYKDFMMVNEITMAELPSRKIQGRSYGADYSDPEGADDADDKKPMKPAAEKRGRGRPAGAKSGARKITGTSKLFK